MVSIENKRVTIVIEGFSGAEIWSDTVKELIDLIYCKDRDFTQQHQAVLFLLQNMMPDARQTQAMMSVAPPEAVS